ncbi:OLC1v1016421C4 [Oldenlandia corymbosa var. corymbosa]|uniref:OLC1v1016421C4 n=1 Tax=Oldenlandia corymbosa var. corymbosa TaxID=529605 RepID=A0AAV1E5M0_OLDCO|nr:OLC1v1016421C4 [Oldenlandia corymbosa var. corymbosa]
MVCIFVIKLSVCKFCLNAKCVNSFILFPILSTDRYFAHWCFPFFSFTPSLPKAKWYTHSQILKLMSLPKGRKATFGRI